MINWDKINTVLLDMDGTLLDLNYDNHFWLEYVPRVYAQYRQISLDSAHQDLAQRYAAVAGTLDWYCVDYWSRELDLDIAALKCDVDHLIAVHPDVEDFLRALRRMAKKIVLVTNAHPKSLTLKMQKTQLEVHFDRLISAHDLGFPKEHPHFWPALQTLAPFEPQQTVFIDDNLPILRQAARFGISHLFAIAQPDSRKPAKEAQEFYALKGFYEIMP